MSRRARVLALGVLTSATVASLGGPQAVPAVHATPTPRSETVQSDVVTDMFYPRGLTPNEVTKQVERLGLDAAADQHPVGTIEQVRRLAARMRLPVSIALNETPGYDAFVLRSRPTHVFIHPDVLTWPKGRVTRLLGHEAWHVIDFTSDVPEELRAHFSENAPLALREMGAETVDVEAAASCVNAAGESAYRPAPEDRCSAIDHYMLAEFLLSDAAPSWAYDALFPIIASYYITTDPTGVWRPVTYGELRDIAEYEREHGSPTG